MQPQKQKNYEWQFKPNYTKAKSNNNWWLNANGSHMQKSRGKSRALRWNRPFGRAAISLTRREIYHIAGVDKIHKVGMNKMAIGQRAILPPVLAR